jgi:hypothetical protein
LMNTRLTPKNPHPFDTYSTASFGKPQTSPPLCNILRAEVD